MKYLIAFILLSITSAAFAGQLINNVQFNFIGVIEQKIPEWADIGSRLALKIFTILWCFETFTQLVFKHVLRNNMKELPTYLITRICFAGIFAYVLLKPDVYLGIIEFLGSRTTAITFTGNLIHGFDVGWVFAQFKEWNDNVYMPAQDALGALHPGLSFTYGLMYVIYLICSCCITLMIIILEVQIYLTVFGALSLTGFAGSTWTYGLWNKYIDAIIGIGFKLLIFGMLFGLYKSLISINPVMAAMMDIITSSATIILVTACLYIFPRMIAGIVSGAAAGNGFGEAIAMSLGAMATTGYMAGKVADKWNSLPSGDGGGDTSNKNNNNNDANPNDPLNNDIGAETPAPKRMPPNWKPGDK